jgi:hypothetical protein
MILSALVVSFSANAAVQCELSEQVATRDGDGNAVLSVKSVFTSTTKAQSSRQAATLEKSDNTVYLSVADLGDEVRVFIRDKKNMTALSYQGPLQGKARWLLSAPGNEIESGYVLSCERLAN